MNTFSLYLHIPFCARRCTYCDFNTTGGKQALIPDYLNALVKEIEWYADNLCATESIKSIYFGGGTPSLLAPAQVERLLKVIQKRFLLQDVLEITLEANPGTISCEYLKDIHAVGINRLSLGVQSANDDELKMLGRLHNWEDVKRGVEWSRRSKFNNLSLDLIYGLPEQSFTQWSKSVEKVLSLNPEHISLYSLTLEPGTILSRRVREGVLQKADDDLTADMLEYAMDRLGPAGYLQYEISNWARASNDRRFESVHNKQYWKNLPYLGVGAGAHSCYRQHRFANVRRIHAYINRINQTNPRDFFSSAVNETTFITREEQMRETMMLGLRLTDEGISLIKFQQRFGKSAVEVFEEEISKLEKEKLIEISQSSIRLTRRGRMIGNQAFMLFVTD